MATIANKPQAVQVTGMDNLTIETVTPERAQEFLDTVNTVEDINARDTRANKVTEIAVDILDGKWMADIDSFKFDQRGLLRDGNNRCKAIIEAGMTVPVMIRRNCTEEYLARIDTGTARTNTAVLKIHATYNPKLMGRALLLQWQYENQYLPGSRTRTRTREGVRPLNTRNILAHLEDHPRMVDSVRCVVNTPGLGGVTSSRKGLGSLGEFAWCHYAISNVNPGRRDKVDEYFRRLAQGIYTLPDDALISVRSRLFQHVNTQQQHLKLPPGMAVALTLKGWNLWSQGIEKKLVRWNPDPNNAMTNDPSGYGEIYPHPIQSE